MNRLPSHSMDSCLGVPEFPEKACQNKWNPHGGRSMVCSQTGEILIRLENSGVGIAVATESPVGWHAKAMMLQSIRCSDRICHWLHNWPSC